MEIYKLNFTHSFHCVIIHRNIDVGIEYFFEKCSILTFLPRQQVICSAWIKPVQQELKAYQVYNLIFPTHRRTRVLIQVRYEMQLEPEVVVRLALE